MLVAHAGIAEAPPAAPLDRQDLGTHPR